MWKLDSVVDSIILFPRWLVLRCFQWLSPVAAIVSWPETNVVQLFSHSKSIKHLQAMICSPSVALPEYTPALIYIYKQYLHDLVYR